MTTLRDEVRALLWQGQSDQDGAYNDAIRDVLALMPEEGVALPERRRWNGFAIWRGRCGHVWDRRVEDTDQCPRCGVAR